MAQTLTNLLTHIIFGTKDRRPFLRTEVRTDLHAYLGGILRELNGKALAVGGTEDHVHLLISLPATMSVAEAMRIIKANSSKWIHAKWPKLKWFAWQAGYSAFSVSSSNVPVAIRYIADQERHHRRFSFQDELIGLLKRHGVEYDERYIWR